MSRQHIGQTAHLSTTHSIGLPGNILHELIHNDRIIGGIDNKSSKEAASFYKNFVKGNIYETTAKIAELCKLTENSFRDTNIAFANELSMICDKNNIELIRCNERRHSNRHPAWERIPLILHL